MATKNIKAGNAFVEIGIRNRIAAGAKGVQNDLTRLSNSLKSHGQSIIKLGGAISTAMAAPLALALRAGSEMQETMGKFSTVFGDAASEIQKWGSSTATAMGVSEQSMMAMLASMQDLLVPMGVAPIVAQDMSKELSALAIDLASFNNMNPAKAFEDLMAAMTGSGEVMKKYGVILSQTAVNQKLLNDGLDPKKASEAQKAQARLTIIMKGTTAAQGDAIRTSGSFANQLKSLKALLSDVAVALGQPLLDPMAKFLGKLKIGIGSIKEYVKQNFDMVRVLGLSTVAVAGLGVAFVGLGGVITAGGIAFGVMAKGVALLLNPIALVLAGVAALGLGIAKYTELGGTAIAALQERFSPLVATIKQSIQMIVKALAAGDIETAWKALTAILELAWLDLTDEMKSAWVGFWDFALDTTSNISAEIATLVRGLADLFDRLLQGYERNYNTMYQSALKFFSDPEVRVIGKPVALTAEDPGAKFATKNLGLTGAVQSMRDFGREMYEEVRRRKQRRDQQRDFDKEMRDGRRVQLLEELDNLNRKQYAENAANEEATQTANDKNEEENKTIDMMKLYRKAISDTNKQFGNFLSKTTSANGMDDALGGMGSVAGQTGTFSAFGASIIGRAPEMQKVTDPALLKEQKILNRLIRRVEKNTRRAKAQGPAVFVGDIA